MFLRATYVTTLAALGLCWALNVGHAQGAVRADASTGSAAAHRPGPRNVVIMIGDGMGFSHVEAGRLYQRGPLRQLSYQRFPVAMAATTYAAGGSYDPQRAWSEFSYVKEGATDSGAAATAMACGVKTYSGAIGGTGTPDAFVPRENVVERAERLGKITGVVTSVQFSHATPAGFVAHSSGRGAYEEIAHQMLCDSATDVIMGAGHPDFDNDARPRQSSPNNYRYVGGEAVWRALKSGQCGADSDGDSLRDPWALVQTRAQFRRLMRGETAQRVLGVAKVATTLQQGRSGASADEQPFSVKRNRDVPRLSEMVRAALNVLDEDPDGLFLMVEGGAIDWAAHANQSARVIEEQLEFNRAVDAVIRWVRENSSWEETLLIVTADHETGYLWGPGSSGAGGADPVWNPLPPSPAGQMPAMEWNSGGHTNSLVPVYAIGAGAERLSSMVRGADPVYGPFIDNTDIAALVFSLWPSS